MSVIYKTELVPITKHDVEKFAELSEEEKALIGQVYIDKAMFNAECTRRLKDAKKKLDEYATIIKSEEHEVPCRVEVDLHDNKARIYREDTGEYVRSRPIEDDERQGVMFAPPAPVRNTASEAAKAKSPGLKDRPEDQPTKKDELLGKLDQQIANAKGPKPVAETPAPAVPDEVRAAVIEAGVPDSMVEAAIGAIRDGGDPETVIKNAKRAVKGEKPAKEKKPGKKKDVPTPEEQARLDLLRELRDKFGLSIGTDAAFAVTDGRMDRAQAIAVGEELKAALEADDEFDGHHTSILDDVFGAECLSVEDAIHNARLRIAKIAEARADA